MSPSSDIETLFGHFGGNAGDYQEIGRENEASAARTRWPLLVTLDLTQPSIPAIAQLHEPVSNPLDQAAQTQPAQDGTREASGLAKAGQAGTARMRSKTPLFARPHRRTIPAVGSVAKGEPLRGAERFSALPAAADPETAMGQGGTPAAPPAVAPSVIAPAVAAPVVPVAQPVRVAPVAPAAPSVPAARAFAPPAPPAATQQPSILGKLFASTTHPGAPAAETPAPQTAPAPLGSVFDRLRGAAPDTAPPAPHSWLTTGPRRS
jgi:hypothetical protein